MGGARSSLRYALPAARLAVAVVALAIAFLVGRTSASSAPRAGELARQPSVDHSHTPEGAVAAYLRQQARLGDPRVWLSDRRRRASVLVKVVASAEGRRSIERSMDTAVGGGNPLGRALRSHRTVLARSAPLGYRVLSYSPARAVLDMWVFSLLGGHGIPLDLRLARYRASELWIRGRWRLGHTRTVGEGSVARFRGAPRLSARLAISLARFRRLRLAP
jgi:hypothetical protein